LEQLLPLFAAAVILAARPTRRSSRSAAPCSPSCPARRVLIAMRASEQIGDDAFHRIEEELDWLEMADGRRGQ